MGKLEKQQHRQGRIVDEDTTTQTRSRVDEDTTTQTDRKNIEWWNEWFKSPLYVKFI